jgi:hypothetical protein
MPTTDGSGAAGRAGWCVMSRRMSMDVATGERARLCDQQCGDDRGKRAPGLPRRRLSV